MDIRRRLGRLLCKAGSKLEALRRRPPLDIKFLVSFRSLIICLDILHFISSNYKKKTRRWKGLEASSEQQQQLRMNWATVCILACVLSVITQVLALTLFSIEFSSCVNSAAFLSPKEVDIPWLVVSRTSSVPKVVLRAALLQEHCRNNDKALKSVR